jgi:hypothetical protein
LSLLQGRRQGRQAHKGRFLHCREGKTWMTREESRISDVQLVTKTEAQHTIFCIKSSLSTIPPCLPSPTLTDNIKNLPLSGGGREI